MTQLSAAALDARNQATFFAGSASRAAPDLEYRVVSNVMEILVCRQHRQFMAYAQLSQEGIDGADLHPDTSAASPEFRGCDVIIAVWHKQGEGGEPVQNLIAGLRA
jgi:hypothetical protein